MASKVTPKSRGTLRQTTTLSPLSFMRFHVNAMGGSLCYYYVHVILWAPSGSRPTLRHLAMTTSTSQAGGGLEIPEGRGGGWALLAKLRVLGKFRGPMLGSLEEEPRILGPYQVPLMAGHCRVWLSSLCFFCRQAVYRLSIVTSRRPPHDTTVVTVVLKYLRFWEKPLSQF